MTWQPPKVAFSLVALVLLGWTLALGGAPDLALGVGSILLMVAAVLSPPPPALEWENRLLFLFLAVPFVSTLLALVPLPLSWLAALGPANHSALEAGLAPYTSHSMAVDSAAAARQLVFLGSMMGLWRCAVGNPTLVALTLPLVTIAGSLTVMSGVLHGALGWVFTYDGYGEGLSPFPTCFVNPNHQAAMFGFASFVGLSCALRASGRRSYGYLAASLACGAGLLISNSRGALIAFGVTAAWVAGLALRSSDRHRRVVIEWTLGAVALAMFLLPTLQRELSTLSLPEQRNKLLLWSVAVEIVEVAPFWGVGPGGFPWLALRMGSLPQDRLYTHVENQYLQLLVDHGMLVGLLSLGLAVPVVWRHVFKTTTLSSSVAGAAILFLLLQNIGDFSLALPAIAAAAVLVTSTMVNEPIKRPGNSPWKTRFALLAIPLALVMWALNAPTSASEEIRDALARGVVSDSALFQIAAKEPANPYPLLVAAAYFEDNNAPRRTLRFANRALQISPNLGLAHWAAARALVSLGLTPQARLQYRLALQHDPTQAAKIARDLSTRGMSGTDAMIDFGTLPPPVVLSLAKALLRNGQPRSALTLATMVSQDDAMTIETLRIGLRSAAGAREWKTALVWARRLEQMEPLDFWSYALGSEAANALGQAAEAEQWLVRGLARAAKMWPLLRRRVHQLSATGRHSEAIELAQLRLRRLAEDDSMADAHFGAGLALAAANRQGEAETHFRHAIRLQPRELDYYAGLATLLAEQGRHADVSKLIQRARRQLPADQTAILEQRARSDP